MMLRDIRDYMESLGLADYVYMGTMDEKNEKSIGVYNSKHQYPYTPPIGGMKMRSYEIKHITLLIHWTRSPTETEQAANKVFTALTETNEVTVNDKVIKFIQPLYDAQDIGTDEKGIYEQVIEAAFVCRKE